MATTSSLLGRQLGKGPDPPGYAYAHIQNAISPTLKQMEMLPKKTDLADQLEKLLKEVLARFKDYEFHEHSHATFSSPFHTDIDKAPIDIQLELIDFQHRTDLKTKYVKMDLGDFYRKYLDQEKLPNLRNFMAYNIIFFGSTCSCEQFFSKMDFMKFACRAVMTGEQLENGFRVAAPQLK